MWDSIINFWISLYIARSKLLFTAVSFISVLRYFSYRYEKFRHVMKSLCQHCDHGSSKVCHSLDRSFFTVCQFCTLNISFISSSLQVIFFCYSFLNHCCKFNYRKSKNKTVCTEKTKLNVQPVGRAKNLCQPWWNFNLLLKQHETSEKTSEHNFRN